VVFATAIASVAFGIFTAYYTVIAILNVFGQDRQVQSIALVPSQTHASGD
jgi:hypothetical protein